MMNRCLLFRVFVGVLLSSFISTVNAFSIEEVGFDEKLGYPLIEGEFTFNYQQTLLKPQIMSQYWPALERELIPCLQVSLLPKIQNHIIQQVYVSGSTPQPEMLKRLKNSMYKEFIREFNEFYLPALQASFSDKEHLFSPEIYEQLMIESKDAMKSLSKKVTLMIMGEIEDYLDIYWEGNQMQ